MDIPHFLSIFIDSRDLVYPWLPCRFVIHMRYSISVGSPQILKTREVRYILGPMQISKTHEVRYILGSPADSKTHEVWYIRGSPADFLGHVRYGISVGRPQIF